MKDESIPSAIGTRRKPVNRRTQGRLRERLPRVIDLFAGAGLFGYAFELEGFDCLDAYEIDAVACETHRLNSHAAVHAVDLLKQRPGGRCEVLIAGPPCQGFSSLGTRRVDDPRNRMCRVIPIWAAVTRPKVIVVENVRPFVKSTAWREMNQTLLSMGYASSAVVVNARDYGVAQNRIRSITVFSTGGLPDVLKQQEKATCVRESFCDLPKFPTENLHHFCLPQSEYCLKRIRLVPYGGDIRDIYRQAPSFVPPSWIPVRDKIVDIWGRLTWEGASNTVRTGFLHPSRGRFLHPEHDRPVSFREAARLQSIPDQVRFIGCAESVSRQIGNAVPVKLGRAIARAVKQTL